MLSSYFQQLVEQMVVIANVKFPKLNYSNLLYDSWLVLIAPPMCEVHKTFKLSFCNVEEHLPRRQKVLSVVCFTVEAILLKYIACSFTNSFFFGGNMDYLIHLPADLRERFLTKSFFIVSTALSIPRIMVSTSISSPSPVKLTWTLASVSKATMVKIGIAATNTHS